MTPITKTIGELFQASGWGATCKSAQDLLDVAFPGWNEDTSVDLLTYDTAFRNAGLSSLCNYSYYRKLTGAQQKQYINWALGVFLTHVPDINPHKAAMVQLKLDLADYITAPTAPKKAALLATAKAIKPNTSDNVQLFVKNAFKGITVAVANNTVDGSVINEFSTCLKRAGQRLSSKTAVEMDDIILTKLEQIIGIID